MIPTDESWLRKMADMEEGAEISAGFFDADVSQLEAALIACDGGRIRTVRGERRWKKRQADKERRRIEREEMAKIEARIHDFSDE